MPKIIESEEDDDSYEEEEDELESDSGSDYRDSYDLPAIDNPRDAPKKPHKDVKKGPNDDYSDSISAKDYRESAEIEESKEVNPDINNRIINGKDLSAFNS